MTRLKTRFTRSALDTLYVTGIYRFLEPVWSGVGVIFTLHRVRRSEQQPTFAPNRALEITPEFLDLAIQQVLKRGYDIVTLDEVQKRLIESDFRRKFVCFTIDDGYADVYYNAFPIFETYGVPFTVYIATGLPDATAVLWWLVLEKIIRHEPDVTLNIGQKELVFKTNSIPRKYHAFDTIYWVLRRTPELQRRITIQYLIERYRIDSEAICRAVAMSWDMIAELSRSELVTIGAHTAHHYSLSRLPPCEIREEVCLGRDILARKTGLAPRHFCYPYGDQSSAGPREFRIIQDLDFATATTTRKGMLFPEHAQHLHALPRISLNGEYQSRRYVQLFLSGAPFALWQRFRRIDVRG